VLNPGRTNCRQSVKTCAIRRGNPLGWEFAFRSVSATRAHGIAAWRANWPFDPRGGCAHNEGHVSSDNDAPLPIDLRTDQQPSTLTLPVWESVKAGTGVRVRLVLFQSVESDELAVEPNGTVLKQDIVHATWKGPRIFSPDAQPSSVTLGALVKNLAAQKLTSLEFLVPADILKCCAKSSLR
jgi:hypothetical protein